MDNEIRFGTERLEKEGHSIRRIFLGNSPRYLIDEEFPITGGELRELGTGVYSFAELTGDLLTRRSAEETQK